MVNSEKTFPGLKGMLIASLVVFILVVAWITVSLMGVQTPILNLVDVEPIMGLLAMLALMVVFAASVYGGAGVLIVIWVVYGIFLLARNFRKKAPEGEAVSDALRDVSTTRLQVVELDKE